MNTFKKILFSSLAISLLVIGIKVYSSTLPSAPAIFETSLATPITASATSMTLVSGTLVNGSALSGYTCFTVDSGTPTVEFICGTATGTSITSLVRGVDTLTGTTSVPALEFSHRRGADIKITDFPVLTIARNIINGSDTFPNPITYAPGVTPVNNQDLASKAYVLSVVSGGTVSTNQIVIAGIAGENVSTGNLVYLKSDGLWWKASALTSATVDKVQLGIAQSAGISGLAITGGVLTRGVDTHDTGTAGNYGYVSDTSGAIGTSAGTISKIIGQFIPTAGGIYFDPNYYGVTSSQIDALTGSQGVPNSSNKYITQDNVYTADTDQTQATENSSQTVGEANSTTKHNLLAQSFTPAKTKIRGVKLYKIADTGTFTGTVTVDLEANTTGSPSGTSLGTVTLTNARWLALSVGEFEADFTSEYDTMTVGNLYWIVVSTSTADNSNHPNLGDNTAGGYASGSVKYKNTTDNWIAIATIDLYFKTLQGVSSQLGYISAIPVVRTYLSSGTYTKPAGLNYIIVDITGAGGGGGGCAVNSGSAGGGGASGTFASVKISAALLSASETVTIGTAGTVTQANDGGNGGTTSFGSFVSAVGGNGGKGNGVQTGGTVGTVSTGLGVFSTVGLVGANGVSGVGGNGGKSAFAIGGIGGGVFTTPENGFNGSLGSGGGGGSGVGTAPGTFGGTGGAGYVRVTEFY